MWCLMQNRGELAIHDGGLETAALLMGFADAGFRNWEEERQWTERRQRERIFRLLDEAGMPQATRERLMAAGAALILFEAELLAKTARQSWARCCLARNS